MKHPVTALLTSLLDQPEGQISPSVYETGRLVSRAPWLRGDGERQEFLLAAQQADGTWGGPGAYGLVPTLSATEALLVSLRRDPLPDELRERLQLAADAGLRALHVLVAEDEPLPDTVAVELIVPELVAQINTVLGGDVLGLPPGIDPALPPKLRAALEERGSVPAKLLHTLEIAGVPAGVTVPRPGGVVGCSPAATATWLAHDPEGSTTWLESLTARFGGPVPSVVPITVFERTWVLAELVRAGLGAAVPVELIDALEAAVADGPTPGAPGLPPDADTTSVTLFTLARLGRLRDPGCLLPFELATHFCCWQGENTASPTANAHVLEALTEYRAQSPETGARYGPATAKIVCWLAGVQLGDGSWLDKWHASPYYATSCCVQALCHAGEATGEPVRRAVDWVLRTQRPDGSWGRWAGTAEETAYALRVLIHAGRPVTDPAVERGHAFLLGRHDHPPLWQDKDLYTPGAVVRAAVLATRHLIRPGPVPLGGAFMADLPGTAGRLREAGPVHEVLTPDGERAWLVTRYDDVRAALTDPALSLNRAHAHSGYRGSGLPPELDVHLLNLDPADHARLRALVAKAFTPQRIAGLRPYLQWTADQLLDGIAEAGRAELIESYAVPLPMAAIAELMGIPPGDREAFRNWTQVLVDSAPDRSRRLRDALQQLLEATGELLESKRAHPGEDLLSALIAARDVDDRLSEHELLSITFLLFAAGYETSMNLIGNGVHELLRNPERLTAVRAEPDSLPGMVEELLRHSAPAALATRRFPVRPVDIGGVRVPAGEMVLLSLASANRDPRRFPRPDELLPDRPPGDHLAFGRGIHHCLGASQARTVGRIGIGAVLTRFPHLALTDPDGPPAWRPSLRTRGLLRLPVTF